MSDYPTHRLADIALVGPPRNGVMVADEQAITFVPMAAVHVEGAGLSGPGLRPWGEVKKGYTIFSGGDVLLAKITPCLENGKIAVVPDLVNGIGAGSTEFHVIRPTSDLSPDWLKYFLVWPETRRNLRARMTGTAGQLRVPKSAVESLEIPLPPRVTQDRLVAELDAHFSRLDVATATLERVQRNLKRYRASVLEAAVTGRLVPTEASLARAEGRSYEPASELLARILEERRARWKASGKRGKYKEPIAPDTENLPQLPEGWIWATVEQITEFVTDGDHQPPPQVDSGVPFLVIGNVNTGSISFEGCRFVPESYFNSLPDAKQPVTGDLLYTVTGSFGIVVPVRSDRRFCVQRHIAILRPAPALYPDLLLLALRSDIVFAQARRLATGTAQKTVPLTGLRQVVIPLPPAEEQPRIVGEAWRCLEGAEGTERNIKASRSRLHDLRSSVLHSILQGDME